MSKKARKIDPRIARTREFLRDALIGLIKEKGFENVKVQEITDRARLNRATFYLHYRDKNDLLVKSMRETLEYMTDTSFLPNSINPSELTQEMIILPLVSIFDHFAKHADFYRVMLTEVGVPSVQKELQNTIEEVAFQWMTALQTEKVEYNVKPEMVVKSVSAAFIGVIRWWLENEMAESSESMATQFLDVIALGIFRILGLDLPSSLHKNST